MKRLAFRSTLLAAALSATCGSAAINDGIAVTALPAPDGDGAYMFGNANYSNANFFDDQLAAGLAYPVWDAIGVPEGSTVKFVGGVALSSLPAGCACDFSGATHVFVTDAAVFGSGFTIPEGTTLLFEPCTVTVNGAVASFANPSGDGVIDVPVAINGTNTVGKDRGNIVFNEAVTGADSGYVMLAGFSRSVTFNGDLDFGGMDEVEQCAKQLEGVNECASLYYLEKEQIYLFYSGEASVKDIAKEMRARLDGFMVPRKFVQLDEMPHLSNGKIDMQTLRSTYFN